MQDANALAHFLDAAKIAIVAIANRTNRNIKLKVAVNQVRVSLADIVFHAAAAKVRSTQAVIDRILFADDANVPCSIDENFIARKQLLALINIDDDFVDELLAL